MKKILILVLVISSFCFSFAEELTLEKVKEVALKASLEVESVLKKELKKSKRESGTKGMTDFCINESVKIIEKIDMKYGPKVSIKRISLNNRNDKSKVMKSEMKILQSFDLIQQSDAYLPNQIVQIVDDNTYKVYSPIEMKSRDCKKCHGLDKRVDKESKKRFSQVYKNENGYGYKSGEVRGAVLITITK